MKVYPVIYGVRTFTCGTLDNLRYVQARCMTINLGGWDFETSFFLN